MKSTEPGWFQVVIDPEDRDVHGLAMAAQSAVWDVPMKMTPWLAAKWRISRWLHPLIHYYVPMKQWDPGSQRVIETRYVTCLWCPRTKEA